MSRKPEKHSLEILTKTESRLDQQFSRNDLSPLFFIKTI